MHKMKLLSLSIEESYTHIDNMLLDGLAALQGEPPPLCRYTAAATHRW